MLHHRKFVPAAATLAVTVLTACGGGGSSVSPIPGGTSAPVASGSAPPSPPQTPAPTAAPTPKPTPTATPSAAPLATAQLAGLPGFVNGKSHTVYVFDGDLSAPGTSTCNDDCATVWPSVAAAAKTYPAPFGEITRSDGSLQLTYAGRPLYTYVIDTAAGSIAGNGITSFGNIWHIARPAGAVAVTPTPMPPGPTY